jgi:hypothetical protein
MAIPQSALQKRPIPSHSTSNFGRKNAIIAPRHAAQTCVTYSTSFGPLGLHYPNATTNSEENLMTRVRGTRLAIVTIGALLSITSGLAFAGDDVTADTIVRALQPKPLTRSLSVTPASDPAATAAEGRFVATLKNRRTRSLSSGEREEIATIAADKPNIDIEITFE